MRKLLSRIPHGLALFIAGVFLDSLRYKFVDHPKTQVIFGKLEAWASSLGFPGTFSHTGIFSQYVIGSAELAAATLLILGIFPAFRRYQGFGALLALSIMTGAVFFHLFTPLGIDPNMDGGGLFIAACLVWLSSLTLVILRFRFR
jgi:hypothetical protein